MESEEIQARFEIAVEEFNQECQKQKAIQQIIIYNNNGVFIDFQGVTINYSLPCLSKDEIKDYLSAQENAHQICVRLLQEQRSVKKKALRVSNSFLASFLLRLSRPSAALLEDIIQKTKLEIAFDKALTEGSLLGQYFFKEVASEYTKHAFDDIRQRLVNHAQNMYENAKDLHSIDVDRLQYFRNKKLLWYEGKKV